jgi:hypothetical protein
MLFLIENLQIQLKMKSLLLAKIIKNSVNGVKKRGADATCDPLFKTDCCPLVRLLPFQESTQYNQWTLVQ